MQMRLSPHRSVGRSRVARRTGPLRDEGQILGKLPHAARDVVPEDAIVVQGVRCRPGRWNQTEPDYGFLPDFERDVYKTLAKAIQTQIDNYRRVSSLADEIARKRFRKEALALAKLNHPNIGTIFEFGNQDGVDFLVTEYIPGITLDAKLV